MRWGGVGDEDDNNKILFYFSIIFMNVTILINVFYFTLLFGKNYKFILFNYSSWLLFVIITTR